MARVLLLEPDTVMAKVVTNFLNKRGHKTLWRPDPQSAINTADRLHPEVVVLDLSLGSHNGIEFLYEFRSYPEWLNIPVILYITHDKHEVESLDGAFLELGVRAILHKPITTLSQLSDHIVRLAPAVA